jgi:hypothetical protein
MSRTHRRPSHYLLLLGLSALTALGPTSLRAAAPPSTYYPAAAPAGVVASTAAAAKAAQAFLESLDAAKRAKAQFAFNDDKQRVNWSNLPVTMVPRAGVKFGELTAAQREKLLAVLAATFSPRGYQKIIEIVNGDEALKDSPGNPPNLLFGSDEFYISFLGTPSPTAPWMLQFGGHHLAVNVTLAGDRGVLTPSLTAAQPASYTLNGKTVRPLGAENDLAFALVNALNPEQQGAAILGSRFRDLVLGPGQDGKRLAPEGVKASTFTDAQKKQLLDLINEWVGILSEPAAKAKLAEIREHLNETYFAWAGPTTPGSAAYFRIQGPTVHIEYAPQNLGGKPVNHIHTIYRDPSNEYGIQFGGR